MTENAVIPMDIKEKNTKVMHVISGLHIGGAEMMLYRLLSKSEQSSIVVSFTENGELAKKIRQLGIEVIELRRGSIFTVYQQLAKLVDQYQPILIQSWLYRADLIAGFVGKGKSVPVIWNVRQTQVDKVPKQQHIWLIQRFNAALSRFLPKQIVYCAQAARVAHESIGFVQDKGLVINNGIDINQFKADAELRQQQRKEWRLNDGDFLIGMVGRFDPLKNHERFLRIIKAVIQRCPSSKVKAVLIGRGINDKNVQLSQLIEQHQVNDNLLLVDEMEDIVAALNAMDMHVLTSDNEGWPNVLAEALSIGLPCVTTNVGDVAVMMQDKEAVVDVNDEESFVEQVIETMQLDQYQKRALAEENRQYIVQHCSLESTVKDYDQLYSAYLSH